MWYGVPLHPLRLSSHPFSCKCLSVSPRRLQVSQSPEAVVLGLETYSLGTVSRLAAPIHCAVQCSAVFLLTRLDVKHVPLQDLSLEIELPVKESEDFPPDDARPPTIFDPPTSKVFPSPTHLGLAVKLRLVPSVSDLESPRHFRMDR